MPAASWSTACPDWRERLLAGRSLIPFEPLFPDEAAGALEVLKALRIVDAPHGPTIGEVGRPWLMDFAAAVFGAYDQESGRRLITEFFLSVAKKNAKSTIAAAIMLTALIRNWRHSAEFLIVAPTIEIANNSFYPARDMVRADPELSALMQVQEHYRTITHRTNGATLKVVAADNETVGGKKATAVLIDELWLFGKQPFAENMLREAIGGLAARPEGFVIYLSTQSDMPPAGVFRQRLMYARGVRDGTVQDKRFLPVLYEFPPELVKDGAVPPRELWGLTNPNLGASVDPEYLDRELQKAQHAGPESMCGFLAKHLNIEIGLALQSDRWAGADFWQQQALEGVTLEAILERCEVVTVGVDGGGLDDLLGLAVVGRDEKTGEWLAWFHAWAHPIVLQRRKAEASRILDLQAAGDLTIVQRPGEDLTEVAGIVARIDAAGLLPQEKAVGLDPEKTHKVVREALIDAGIEEEKLIGIPQGWRLTGAITVTERKLAGGILKHGAQPLMAWCVANAKVEPKGNATLITKQASGSAKIDPLMALFNAVSLMALNPAGTSYVTGRLIAA